MESKPRARLHRTHAAKNIDYEPIPSSPGDSIGSSFRLSEFDFLCKSLGLSAEDFAIPDDDYQAMKVNSPVFSQHTLQRLQPHFHLPDNSTTIANVVVDIHTTEILDVDVDDDVEVERSGCVGIRGQRPPKVELPLPDIISTVEDEPEASSSQSPAPLGSARGGPIEQGDDELVTRGRTMELGRGVADDDSSSTTTDSMSISPSGRLRRQISSWDKARHLGSGSYGSVYEGIADGGFFFAVKEVSLLDQGEKGREIIFQLEQEMAFLSQFEHKNIVRYLGTDKDDSNLYIFLELVPQGSLLSLYQRLRFQDSHVSFYTRQILEGLKYLHERNVVHRDIKCANILLDVDGSVKLADFGLAKVAKLNDAKSCKGTPYWMAPEVVRPNQWYGRAADIWSLGCTVLEMLTRNFPYHPLNGFQAMFQIGNGNPPPVPEILSRDARDFILKCLQVNPDTRPSAADLLDHPFVKSPHSSSASATNHHHGTRA